jgi:hypothetical protein
LKDEDWPPACLLRTANGIQVGQPNLTAFNGYRESSEASPAS